MKRSRGLWVSIGFVGVLVVGSIVGLVASTFKPLLGLDLQGGVAVILSAPQGTDQPVMEQALENIRTRVDAFGVGEPDIFLSGNTIEVQIPGLSNSRLEQRATDAYCLIGKDGSNFGCADTQNAAQAALDELRTASQASQVCLVTGDTQLDCFNSQQEADSAKGLITPAQRQTSGSPSPSPASVGNGDWCLTDAGNNELACGYASKKDAQAAVDAITTKVTQTQWCIQTEGAAAASPTPSASASASASESTSASASASASASPTPGAAFASLDTSGAVGLPCTFASKSDADTALAAIQAQHVTTQWCVVSSQGQDLGCFTTQAAAADRQRETGQQRLLDIIGQTARLEERPTLQVVPPTDPQFASIKLTCATPEEQASKDCKGDAQDHNDVWYLSNGAGEQGAKVRLGPVIITGGNITKATAVFASSGTSLPQWQVNFTLDGDGAKAFGAATTAAVTKPSPQNQIAIAVDRRIESDPVVQSPITNGTGQITGGFTEDEAKNLATLLNAGALPVELTRQSVRTVSPTLGEESLKQGIVAGIVGLILLFVYLLFYYRLLGIVAWFGMSIWALFAITLVSIAGRSFGYALTLAGVAGLVISLGVTADSYIVFFERLKDEVRSGRSPRTAVQPAFRRAFRTIVAADIVTGIAAAVLYLTAVSSVRGFALTLGVATGLDLFVVYFFKRPTVFLISHNARLIELPGFGLSTAAAADHVLDEPVGGEAT